ncbi:hypothetical protein T03_12097 [Trichinella britovi]|uniref:Uncharacterized protein n=1 Tax=Trichinella britovi TaxID=45882 RepID=A0A0V1D4J7_TRIBR|nr:hypothetical protein T03_12097 [Trichinella britovi]
MNNTLTCDRSFTKSDIYMDDTYSFTNDCFGQFFEGVRHETMCNFSTEIKPICLMLDFKKAIQNDIGFFENQVKKKLSAPKV